jgi:hypothetical protein
MTQTIEIKADPILIDASFKYQCPKCQHEHWAELREVSYKGFVIVCLCGYAIKPKTISRIKAIYRKPKKQNQKEKSKDDTQIIKSLCKTLHQYGYTEEEILRAINRHKIDLFGYGSHLDLIKEIIKLLGDN